MMATSANSAGMAASVSPVKGHSTVLAWLTFMRSDPSIVSAGRNGTPMAAARNRRPMAKWLHSSKRAWPPSPCSRRMRDSPQGTPKPCQLVTRCLVAAATISSSASSHDRLRLMTRSRRPWRSSSCRIAIGVRENMQPPMMTWSPSFTSLAAPAALISRSHEGRRLASSRRRASRKSPAFMPLQLLVPADDDDAFALLRGRQALDLNPSVAGWPHDVGLGLGGAALDGPALFELEVAHQLLDPLERVGDDHSGPAAEFPARGRAQDEDFHVPFIVSQGTHPPWPQRHQEQRELAARCHPERSEGPSRLALRRKVLRPDRLRMTGLVFPKRPVAGFQEGPHASFAAKLL